MPGIAEWIDRHAAHTPDATAIRFQGAEISYGELARKSARMARFLAHDLRLGAGERVAYLGPNTPEQLVLTFAAARAGLIVVPLNWRLAAPELAAILANAEPAVLIVEAGFVEAVSAILPALSPCRVYGIGETAGLPLLSDAMKETRRTRTGSRRHRPAAPHRLHLGHHGPAQGHGAEPSRGGLQRAQFHPHAWAEGTRPCAHRAAHVPCRRAQYPDPAGAQLRRHGDLARPV
jgi:acyl-CoA synthetase (AMP-forming)/AMP-acid ligase II